MTTFANWRSRVVVSHVRAARSCAALVVVAFSLACGGGKDSPTSPSGVAGSYVLSKVDGSSLPVTVVVDPASSTQAKVTGGTIQLGTDSRYNARIDFVLIQGANQAPTFLLASGKYSASGSNYTFTSDNPALSGFTGTLDGGTLTLSYSLAGTTTDQLTFVKQ